MTAPLVLRTEDAAGTQAMAAALATLCVPGDIVLLVGDLGAGKTCFAQGFGRSLGIAEPITSPTFTLVRQYPVHGTGEPALECLIHADVYRLGHLPEIADLGIGELVDDGAVALVEWGDVAAPVLGKGALTVRLEIVARDGGDLDLERRVTVGDTDGGWETRWRSLVVALQPWRES